MGSIVLLDLMGGVALLLWGLHMVLSGVLRAFGPNLRCFRQSAAQPVHCVWRGTLFDRSASKQHRYGTDDDFARRRRGVSLVPALAIMLSCSFFRSI